MQTEENIFEQLEQIAKEQPVWAGSLLHKDAKNELVKRGWVMWYEDKNCNPNDRDYKDGGYVLTELGKKCYGAKLLARQSALSGVGGLP